MRSDKYWVFLLLALLSLGANSCAIFHKKNKGIKAEAVVYPAPPDTARYQYLTTINGSSFLGKRSRFSTFVMGKEEVRFINKPYGMALQNGKLYVCDPGLGGIEILDFTKGKYTLFAPGGGGSFKTPLSCAVDSNDY